MSEEEEKCLSNYCSYTFQIPGLELAKNAKSNATTKALKTCIDSIPIQLNKVWIEKYFLFLLPLTINTKYNSIFYTHYPVVAF